MYDIGAHTLRESINFRGGKKYEDKTGQDHRERTEPLKGRPNAA